MEASIIFSEIDFIWLIQGVPKKCTSSLLLQQATGAFLLGHPVTVIRGRHKNHEQDQRHTSYYPCYTPDQLELVVIQLQ